MNEFPNGSNGYSNGMSVKMIDGTAVSEYVFEPMGMGKDKSIQRLITWAMDAVVKADGRYTLAELGYLHMNSVTYTNGHIECRAYFAPELATTTKSNRINGATTIIPNPALEVFKNYLYVGSLDGNVDFDTMSSPKYDIDRNARGNLAISHISQKKFNDDVELLVLHMNIDLLMATAFNCSLFAEGFDVSIETVGSTKKKDDDIAVMTKMNARCEFMVRIVVHVPASHFPYDTEETVPYILDKMNVAKGAKAAKKKLSDKVSDEALKKAKVDKKKATAWSKFR